MANPPTGANEWVELYNPTGSTISLSGWVLLDRANSTKSLNDLGTITPGGYVVYEYPSGDGWLNNTATSTNPETITLRDNTETTVDSFSYTANQNDGITMGRSPDGGSWIILALASKGSSNGNSPSSPSPTPTPTAPSTTSPTPTPSSTSTSTSSFIISNIPSQIDSTETFNASVNLSLSSKPNATFYLKGAFKKQDKTNYFGLTKVNESWIRNNKSYSDHVKITTDSQGFWSGNLEIQPDILDSGYEGAGEYIFKVGRYTESGSLTWSNEVTIRINTQEIILEDSDNDILAISGTQNKKDPTKLSKKRNEENSLEKYIRIATPAAETTAPSNQQAVVKGERTNYLNWVGLFMTACGIGLFAYVYLRSKDLREAIFNLFRKRN